MSDAIKVSIKDHIGTIMFNRPESRNAFTLEMLEEYVAVAVRDPSRGYARVVVGAADGAPLILETTSRLCARGHPEAAAAREAIAADLARAADRQFDA